MSRKAGAVVNVFSFLSLDRYPLNGKHLTSSFGELEYLSDLSLELLLIFEVNVKLRCS